MYSKFNERISNQFTLRYSLNARCTTGNDESKDSTYAFSRENQRNRDDFTTRTEVEKYMYVVILKQYGSR